jgi:hypothetical protein
VSFGGKSAGVVGAVREERIETLVTAGDTDQIVLRSCVAPGDCVIEDVCFRLCSAL